MHLILPESYEIHRERIILRPLDRRSLLGLAKGGRTGPLLEGIKTPDDWPTPELLEALPVMINDLGDDPSTFGWHAWIIILKETKELVGDCGFKGAPDEEGSVEIAYSLLPKWRNKGIAGEAVRALIDLASRDAGVIRVEAETREENIPSIKILENIGMKEYDEHEGMTYWEMIL